MHKLAWSKSTAALVHTAELCRLMSHGVCLQHLSTAECIKNKLQIDGHNSQSAGDKGVAHLSIFDVSSCMQHCGVVQDLNCTYQVSSSLNAGFIREALRPLSSGKP